MLAVLLVAASLGLSNFAAAIAIGAGGVDRPDDAPGAGVGPQSHLRGFPPPGGPVQGEHLHPGEQLAGQRDDLASDLADPLG